MVAIHLLLRQMRLVLLHPLLLLKKPYQMGQLGPYRSMNVLRLTISDVGGDTPRIVLASTKCHL